MIVIAAGVIVVLVTLAACIAYGETTELGGWDARQLSMHLASMVRQNLPLGEGLRAYARGLTGVIFRRTGVILNEIADLLDEGSSLSDALDRHPGAFPAHYRALVRAGERGGNLGRVLARLAETSGADREAAMRAPELFYPFLQLFALSVMILSVILPRFRWMWEDVGLPSGRFDTVSAVALVVFFAGVTIGIVALVGLPFPGLGDRLRRRFPALARASSLLRWRMPLFSRYERRRAVSRYALAAGELLDAGVPTAEALSISAAASGSIYFDRIARDAAARVAEGEKMSAALRAADARGALPGDFLWYLEAGEASGNLADALGCASESASARSRTALAKLVGLLFPAGIVAAGVFVGSLAYVFFEALLNIAASLGL